VDVLDDGRAAGSFAEIEVELVGGDEDDLDRLARALRRAGAHRSSGQPKLMRVLDVDADDVPPPRKATVTEHLRFLLGRQLRELERFDPGVRLGADPEDLHRFRVATRRSRALIRASRDLLGDRLAPLAEELRWLGGALGPVRDLDVLIDHLRAQVATLDDERAGGDEIVAAFEEQRAAARDTMLDALSSDRYAALLDRFAADLAELAPRDAQGGVREIARRELKRLRKAHRALGEEPTDDELHALRIRAKRARYAAELATPVEGKRFARIVDALKELQDVIGVHQDAVVAEAKVRAVAETVAAGRLVERERARRAAARAGVPDAWRRVRRAAAAA
jgi:CHAD domain-containing protein